LLSGDVGSGKTVVAAMALYNTALSDYQGILMAPTEILAQQHFESVRALLPTQRVALFTRSTHLCAENNQVAELSKAELIEGIKTGSFHIIIGTHALLSEGVEFKNVGLVIVDEQHRFGVAQRRVIKEKSFLSSSVSKGSLGIREGNGSDDGSSLSPSLRKGGKMAAHFLSMTATPIPRSLALMLYGDLDVSIISELPVGRKQIITRVVEPSNREKAYAFIRDQVKLGRQVFVICPLIESAQNDTADKKSVLAEYKKLSETIFPDLRVGYLHGRLKGEEKEKIMDDFSAKGGSASGGKNHKLDILVSTSVIEVGVNIPNASVMMIEGADKFGLAQLHQFRGRVGRSEHQSYCLLFPEGDQRKSKERLDYFAAHHNGFALAEKDLEVRGPGEVYGTAQSGMMQLRLAKLTDIAIIKKAREAAHAVAPRLQDFPTLVQKIQEWENSVHLE
jgi:ATP-dependent DNA helicase RecG